MNFSSETRRPLASSRLLVCFIFAAMIFAVPTPVSPQPVRAQTNYAPWTKPSPGPSLKTGQDQETNPAKAGSGVLIRWRARPNVGRYRLQLALDNAFNDIVFDRAVIGNTYRVTDLPQGRYYWRVGDGETGDNCNPFFSAHRQRRACQVYRWRAAS